MARPTVGEVSQEVLKLQAYIETLPEGSDVSWSEVEKETRIKMDIRGKAHFRTALKRAKREYSARHGLGMKLADPDSVMPILSTRYKKIDRTVRRADKTQRILQEQFFHKLTPQDQQQVLYAGLVFGAIRVAAQNGKLIYQNKKPPMAGSMVIPIPKIDF